MKNLIAAISGTTSLRVLAPFRGLIAVFFFLFCFSFAYGEELKLQDLIDEALKNNPELRVAESLASASEHRIPQAGSLPDPMFMFGYQNEGWKSYSYGKSQDAQWMFSASQMFPFPGKLPLKETMASRESDSLKARRDSVRLKTIARVKELYYDLFLSCKSIELIEDRTTLFRKVEEAALARYSSGMGLQQDVLMAQTEKYMLLEREEMLRQKKQALEAMLNISVGRPAESPLGRPSEPPGTAYDYTLDNLLKAGLENYPEIKTSEKMALAADLKVQMAKKEYIPDFTLTAGYFNRGGGQFEDMWSLTTTINIPIYYKTKQRQAVYEAEASCSAARYELESTKLMISSNIRDSYSMFDAAGKLTELYKNGLIPKIRQDFELALAGYSAGKIEAVTLTIQLKSLIDYDILYWEQFVGREKAIARLEAITGLQGRSNQVITGRGEI
jgi:outer membrane protein, heavy metal efflux system